MAAQTTPYGGSNITQWRFIMIRILVENAWLSGASFVGLVLLAIATVVGIITRGSNG